MRSMIRARKLIIPSFLLASVISGCGGGSSSNADPELIARDEFDTLTMLANLADNLFIPSYQAFEEASIRFADPSGILVNYCSAIDTSSEAPQLEFARTEWRGLMESWQKAELFILGPVADNSNALRNQVYSFGSADLSHCGIDQAVVLNQSDDFDINVRPASIRGLDALEYLLFNESLGENCPSQVVETLDWETRPEVERKQLRCEFAQTLADDLADTASSIVNKWSPSGENFRSIFLNPANTSQALTSVSDALFFIDKELKDLKIGSPLGRVGCKPVDCASRTSVESPYSNNSLNNLRANLNGFQAVFEGLNGLSFDDLIISVGEQGLVDEFNDSIYNAIRSIDQVQQSLADAVAAIDSEEDIALCEESIDYPIYTTAFPVCSLYGEVKVISDKLKTEFILATALEIPERAQSDND